MKNNKLKELINKIVKDTGIRKADISRKLGYTKPSSFHTSLKRGGISQRKEEAILEEYGYEKEYKKK